MKHCIGSVTIQEPLPEQFARNFQQMFPSMKPYILSSIMKQSVRKSDEQGRDDRFTIFVIGIASILTDVLFVVMEGLVIRFD